jgi:hypothetical protein
LQQELLRQGQEIQSQAGVSAGADANLGGDAAIDANSSARSNVGRNVDPRLGNSGAAGANNNLRLNSDRVPNRSPSISGSAEGTADANARAGANGEPADSDDVTFEDVHKGPWFAPNGAAASGNAALSSNAAANGASANANATADTTAQANSQASNQPQFHNGAWWFRNSAGNWLFHRNGRWFNTNGTPFVAAPSAAPRVAPGAGAVADPADVENPIGPLDPIGPGDIPPVTHPAPIHRGPW